MVAREVALLAARALRLRRSPHCLSQLTSRTTPVAKRGMETGEGHGDNPERDMETLCLVSRWYHQPLQVDYSPRFPAR